MKETKSVPVDRKPYLQIVREMKQAGERRNLLKISGEGEKGLEN